MLAAIQDASVQYTELEANRLVTRARYESQALTRQLLESAQIHDQELRDLQDKKSQAIAVHNVIATDDYSDSFEAESGSFGTQEKPRIEEILESGVRLPSPKTAAKQTTPTSQIEMTAKRLINMIRGSTAPPRQHAGNTHVWKSEIVRLRLPRKPRSCSKKRHSVNIFSN